MCVYPCVQEVQASDDADGQAEGIAPQTVVLFDAQHRKG